MSRRIRGLAGGTSRHIVARALAATGILGVLLGSVLSVLPVPNAVAATGINEQINFQGKVVNANGTNVTDGSYNFVFSIYTVSSGGSAVWTESKSLTVTDGVFQTNLGDTTTLPGSVDFNTDNIYLGINFNTDGEMTPRIRFTASPYAFNSDLLDGLDASAFAQLNPSSAQSGSLNVTGSVQAATSIQAPLVDTATAVALNVGTVTASSVTVGRATSSTNLTLQGSASTSWSATGASGSTTVNFAAPTATNTITFPNASGTVCTTTASTCSATYQAAGSYLQKNAQDTSTASVAGALLSFSNTNTGASATALSLSNSGTASALSVTQSANPGASQALILANNTAGSPSGNLIDLQVGGSSRFAVSSAGAVTTSSTINSQTISATASFTGTVTTASTLTVTAGGLTVTAGDISATAGNIGTAGTTRLENDGDLVNIGTIGAGGTITVTGAATDLTTGTNEDLTLLANGTGEIVLSDTVQIPTLGAADTLTQLCRNTSNELATCDFSAAGTPFVQGGNSFTAAGELGTNDAFALNIETSGTTRLTVGATGGLTLAAGNDLTFASGAGNFDQSASTGTFATGTGAVSLNGDTTVAAGKNLQLASGTGTFSQTFTGTGNANTITANSLTTGSALRVTSSNNTAANTSWSAISLNPTNAQATTAVSGSNLISGLDVQFTQNAAVAGNTETVANLAVKRIDTSVTDSTVSSILNLANNDEITGNQITVTDAIKINGANVTNGINLSGTFGTNLITSSNFSVSQAGAIVGVGVNSGSGLIQGTAGLTVSGATIRLNENSNNNTNINTGSSVGTISIGGGSSDLAINSTAFDVSAAGALSGITTISTSGTINGQTISSTASFTGTLTTADQLIVSSNGANITGAVTVNSTISGGTTYSASTALQAPLLDTAGAAALSIGTANATSLTLSATDITFTLQGNQSSTITSTNSVTGFDTTVGFVATTGSDKTINFPNESGTLCIQGSTNCGFAVGTFIAKNAQDTSSASVAGTLYSFSNTNTGAASTLAINNAGTNAALVVTNSGNPTTAVLRVNNSNGTPSGNLLALQTGGVDQLVVDYTGKVNGQTISSAANFTGTVTTAGTVTITGAGTDVTTGTNEDLTLLANGTGQIVLNDTTQVATLASADTATLLCRNTSNQIATCTQTLTGTPFLQGGNSFGAAGDLGTNDNNVLNIRTNNATRLTVSTTGDLTWAASSTGNFDQSSSSGTFSTGTGTVSLLGNTQVATGRNFTMLSGAGVFSQAYTGTSTSAHAITANSLTTGSALNITSANNSAANTAWQAVSVNVSNLQGTTAVSTGTIAGLDLQFTQNATVAGNNETVVNLAVKQIDTSVTDNTVDSIINIANNDTATGNQVTVTDGIKINGANVTNGINLNGTFGSNLITASNFSVTQAGVLTAATSLRAPTVDTASAVALNIGTGNASSVTVGRTTTNFTLQGASGVSGSVITAASGANTTTLRFIDPTANRTIELPNESGTVCLQNSSNCGFLTAANVLAKNPTATESSTSSIVGAQYTFRNTNTGAASVLTLSNAGTGSALSVTSTGNPSAGNAVIYAANTNASPSGNLLDLQSGSSPTSKLSVNTSGNLTTAGVLTVNGTASNTFSGQLVLSNVATDITTSTNEDLTLVAAGTGQIVLNDLVQTTILGSADTSTLLCRNTSNQIATCSATLTGSAFVQEGNSFSATAVLGTNDANALEFETSGVTRVSIGATGGLTVVTGGANITGGIDNNSGGITEAGAVSGVTTITQSNSGTSGTSYSNTTTNTGASGTNSVIAQGFTLAGTSTSGTNNITGLNFANVTNPGGTNNFYVMNVGTGFTDLLRYNGTQLISGSGIIQNAAFSTGLTYSNITKVGALDTGSIASGFGTISTANTITGTTLNGTTGVNTGAGAGTQRIDATGNLLNIGTISSGAITVSAATDLTTGTNEDLTLVANGTGQVILNDLVQVASLGTADNNTQLCRNSSNQIATCTGGTNPFVDNGNSFSEAADLGTNDNFELNLRTNTTTRLTIGASGGVTVAANNNLTFTSGTGTITQNYSNTTGTGTTLNATNSAASGTTTVNAQGINLTGTNNGTGTNTNVGINFGNVAAATNNSFYALNFGTGFNDLLRYNGSQLISGSGILQNAAFSTGLTYSNLTKVGALDTGSIASGFGTISTANTITGTTLNGTTGVNTGAGAGTQRIDSTGNLLNIGTISSGAITVSAVTDLTTGTNEDLTLVANGTGEIVLNDLVQTPTLGTADTTTLLCRNSSNQIATCSASLTGSAFIQGGNSFGATAVLGTNESQALEIRTNSTTRLTFGATGGLTVAANNDITLSSGTGVITQNYSNTTGTGTVLNVTNSASAGTTTVTGESINLTGTNNAGGTNTNIGLNFANVAAATNNSFYAINVGTGFTDLLRYNGSQLISGGGKIQDAALDSSLTYTNITGVGALNAGSITSGFGTIDNADTITGTTLNGTTGINTGAGAGTQRIDASGNLVSIGNITGTGAVTISTASSGALALQPSAGGSLTSTVTKNAATGDEVAFDLSATINKATSGNYTGIKLNVTETSAPGAADKLIDLQVASATQMSVSNTGVLNVATGYQIGGSAPAGEYLRGNGTNYVSSTIQAGDLPSLTGTYLRNVPTATSDNTVNPGANNAVALTLRGSSNGANPNILDIRDSGNTLRSYFDYTGALNTTLAIVAPTSTNTINGLVINAGALSSVTSITASGTIQGATLNATTAIQANGSAGQALACGAGEVAVGSTWSMGILTTSGSCQTAAVGTFLAKNSADTSSAAITASNYLYGFTNSSSAVASGVLQLDNGSNTGNALYVTGSGNPGAGNALIVANHTGASGNLLDLQVSAVSKLSVSNAGVLTIAGNQTTDITVVSAAASSAGNSLTLRAGAGGATTGAGGALSLNAGAATAGNNNGGQASLTGGAASGTGTGGLVVISAGAAAAAAGSAGGSLQVIAAAGSATGTGGAGGGITLTAGNAGGSGNNNGGNIQFTAGSATGTGVPGVVMIDTPVFTASSTQNISSNTTLASSLIDSNSTVVINATNPSLTITVPAPTNTTVGRIVYVTVVSGSNSFTLASSGMVSVNMLASDTAMLVWNGSAWTASAAASSLQQVYNNTSTAPASIVTTSSTKNILIKAGAGFDNSTLFQVGNSLGAHAFTVDTTNTASSTNLAQNSGGETGGTPPTSWSAHNGTASPTITQTTVAGEYSAGSAGIKVAIGSAGTGGVRNSLGSALATSTKYNVTFSIKASSALSNANLTVEYYRTNTPTLDVACSAFTAVPISTSAFIKYQCSFTTTSTAGDSTAFLAIRQTDSVNRDIFIDNLAIVAQTTGTQNVGAVQVGGVNSQALTLLTLDSYSSNPFTGTTNTALLGSMYYDTTEGRIQCYESDGWGSCSSAPNNNVTMIAEYGNAVIAPPPSVSANNGTMTASLCSGSGRFNINATVCSSAEEYNYYQWTSTQATSQQYSIYVKYQLPPTFKGFLDANTVKMTARTTNTTNGSVSFSLWGPTGTQCGSTTNVTSGGANTWHTVSMTGDETGCGLAANNVITIRVDMASNSSALVYASNITFTMTGQ